MSEAPLRGCGREHWGLCPVEAEIDWVSVTEHEEAHT